MRAFLLGQGMCPTLGLYRVPRLQGTAALQAHYSYRSLDLNLEGARSLGAVSGDESSFSRTGYVSNAGSLSGSAAARTAALQADYGCPTIRGLSGRFGGSSR